MHRTNNQFKQSYRFGLTAWIAAVLFIAVSIQTTFAEKSEQQSFKSAGDASQALFTAVQAGDEEAVAQLLDGLASSDDKVQDKRDRERFVQKYQEMRRLAKQPDGTTVLYIGAENWPFPVPLVSENGSWHFDTDAGAQEIRLRRIGENELTAVKTCRALLQTSQHAESGLTDDDVVNQYVHKVVGSPGRTAEVFHGYYFRILPRPSRTSAEPIFLAYPAEYGSTGIMTFIVTSDGVVSEKDLGPKSAEMKAGMKLKLNRTWHAIDE